MSDPVTPEMARIRRLTDVLRRAFLEWCDEDEDSDFAITMRTALLAEFEITEKPDRN